MMVFRRDDSMVRLLYDRITVRIQYTYKVAWPWTCSTAYFTNKIMNGQ